jgi:ACS family tartrate transporter-like MFS transporter
LCPPLSSSTTPPLAASTPLAVDAKAAAEREVFAKIGWRLMPLLTTAYILNYLDRTNVSFAALTMNQAIGLTATQFGLGSGLFFFLGYCFLEVPSNVALYRFGPRRWLSRIMISWGLVSAAMSLAIGPNSFYVFRLLLGAAEAGFFPGVAFFLATWFPGEYRTRIIAWFMVAIPISSVIGGPVSGLLLALDGWLGLAGWQWLFIVEGLPAVIVGFVLFSYLPDRPEDASWLSDDERRIVRERLEAERRPKEVKRLALAFRDVRVLILAGVQFGFLVGSYGIGIFLPQILDTGRLTDLQIGFVTSGCYAAASVTMILWAGRVDRHGNKVGNLSKACAVAAVGFVGSILFSGGFQVGSIVFPGSFWFSVFWIMVAVSGVNAARALFWTIPPRFLSGLAMAGGLAFINSIGTMGGFVGPTIMGWLRDYTGSFQVGQMALGGFLLAASLLAWSLKRFEAE